MDLKKLYEWCSIPAEELPGRTDLKVPFRIVKDSHEPVSYTHLDVYKRQVSDGAAAI